MQATTCGGGLAGKIHDKTRNWRRIHEESRVSSKSTESNRSQEMLRTDGQEDISLFILAVVLLSSIECSGAIEAESDRLPRGLSISHVLSHSQLSTVLVIQPLGKH